MNRKKSLNLFKKLSVSFINLRKIVGCPKYFSNHFGLKLFKHNDFLSTLMLSVSNFLVFSCSNRVQSYILKGI